MGRNSKQQSKIDANELTNFQFQPSQPAQASYPQGRRSQPQRQKKGNTRGKQQQYHKASVKKRNPQFYLISSPDHAFVITRIPPKHQTYSYSFQGSDTHVTWESVKMVKTLTQQPMKDSGNTFEAPTCPICLDHFVCPRITKCGHTFCLACLIHHIQAAQANNPYTAIKCPCCGLPVFLNDVRPVVWVATVAPSASTNPKKHSSNHQSMVKLHRHKTCGTPYLPLHHAPRRLSPHAAPMQTDVDCLFSKFNYVCPDVLAAHLQTNLQELNQQLAEAGNSEMEIICQRLALEHVQQEVQLALSERASEVQLQHQFHETSSGVYQWHPPELIIPEDTKEVMSNLTIGDASTPDSVTNSPPRSKCRTPKKETKASLYAGDDEYVFYQAQDGALCFLSGFNMKCLKFEFPDALPDTVVGAVLGIERISSVGDVRSRFRFLSHLPENSELLMLELDLGDLLSKATKKKFAKEFQSRQAARKQAWQKDQKADRKLLRAEQQKIAERKARYQRVDPEDTFFHSVEEPIPLTGDEFGPALAPPSPTRSDRLGTSPPVALSFSQITRENGSFPTLNNTSDFPSLSAADVETKSPPAPSIYARTSLGKKKKGSKKTLLFSTGSHRSFS